jgi:hypothetical protein
MHEIRTATKEDEKSKKVFSRSCVFYANFLMQKSLFSQKVMIFYILKRSSLKFQKMDHQDYSGPE